MGMPHASDAAETSRPPELFDPKHPAPVTRHRRRRRIALSVIGGLLTVVLVVIVIGAVTPWPSALLIRSVFEKGGAATVAEMTPYVPEVSLRERIDVAYADGGASHTLTVYTIAPEGKALPTVFWIHGGAWISGSDTNVAPYLKILAAKGYTTIGVNYTLGPEATYPTAV